MSANGTNEQSASPDPIPNVNAGGFGVEPTFDYLDVIELLGNLRSLLDSKPGGRTISVESAVFDGTLHYADLDRALRLALDRVDPRGEHRVR